MDSITRARTGNSLVAVTLDGVCDGETNMSVDCSLLERAELGGVFVRIYRWDGPWVSLGRFQRPERALKNVDLVPWVMRPTGGKSVLHGHDVTVTIAANLNDLGLDDSASRRVSNVYRRVVEPLADAMTASGLPAVIAEKTQHVRNAGHTADCFAHVSPNDVVDPNTGSKVCGCALRVTQSAVLLQSSIPVSPPLIDPSTVFDAPSVASTRRNLDEQCLAQELQERLAASIERKVGAC